MPFIPKLAAVLMMTATGITVGQPAERTGFQHRPDAVCDLTTVNALADRHPDVKQFVVMATDSFGDTKGTVEVAAFDGATWQCQMSPSFARFGRTGTRPIEQRRSGDGTTPAGVFPMGEVEAWDGQVFNVFGNRDDPGQMLTAYREVRPEDCWGATANTSRYGHLVNRPRCAGPEDEWLPRYGDVYSHAAVIGANLDPVSGDEPGEIPYAAAIFLHRHSYASNGSTKTTSGCVSLAYEPLLDTIRLLDPELTPHYAIGPREWLRTTA